MPAASEWTRVIVLAPVDPTGGHGLSDELKAEFSARDWFAIVQPDPYHALVELCLRERAQISRASWGLQRLEKLALVIVEPGRWPETHDLIDTVARYVPEASVWGITGNDLELLHEPATAGVAGIAEPAARIAPSVHDGGFARSQRSRAQAATVDELAPVLRMTNDSEQDDSEQDDSEPAVVVPLAVACSADSANARSQPQITRQEIDMLLAMEHEALSSEDAPAAGGVPRKTDRAGDPP